MRRVRVLSRKWASALLSIAAALVFASPTQLSVLQADVDDFRFDSYHADYTLGRDAEGRSTLRTTETFVVEFPDFDQNRGFIRSVPWLYNGFSIDTRELSVTDENGVPHPFEYEYSWDFIDIIMAVPEGQYVHGTQTYVIGFEQRDVTAHFGDTGSDEFYWDLNGTDTLQPFGAVSATLTLSDGIEKSLSGGTACYRGELGSTTPCMISQMVDSEGATIFTVEERDLGPGESVTIAVGFAPGTFTPPPESERIYDPDVPTEEARVLPFASFTQGRPVFLWGSFATFVGALAVAVGSGLRASRKEQTGCAIIAQYDPPVGISAALSADVMRVPDKAMTVTILDLAVRRKLRLMYDAPADRYGVQAENAAGLLPIEAEVYDALFDGADAEVPAGTEVWFYGKFVRLGETALALQRQAREDGKRAELYGKPSNAVAVAAATLVAVCFALLVLHAIASGGVTGFIIQAVAVVLGGFGILWFVWPSASTRPTLTHQGVLLRDHLLGLKEYIRLAEADRIRMLQSVSGTEVNEQRIVQVYERLLPYAVIFGQENEWRAELARYYRDTPPDWVAANTEVSRVLQFGALRLATASSTTPRSSGGSRGGFSSRRGGSQGGGFAGGGGGGGGTRGI